MTRRYVQRARAEAALQTRHQILDAARAVLLDAARPEVAVGDVAATAGVARSTVYATFGSRAGLLAALADDTLERAGLAGVIAEYQRPDPVEAVERSLVASCRMYAAEHRAFARLLVLGQVDPDAAEPLARSQADRARGMRSLADRLAAQDRLRPGVDAVEAASILSVLTSFWTFDELHVARGLSAESCGEVLVAIARTSVLGLTG